MNESDSLVLSHETAELRRKLDEFIYIVEGRDGKSGMLKDIQDMKLQNTAFIDNQKTTKCAVDDLRTLFIDNQKITNHAIDDLRTLVRSALYLIGGGALVSIFISVIALIVSIAAYIK